MSLFYGYCSYYFIYFNYRHVCLLVGWFVVYNFDYLYQFLHMTSKYYFKQLCSFMFLLRLRIEFILKWKYITKLNSPTMTPLISRDRSICNLNLFSLIEYGGLVLWGNKVLKKCAFRSIENEVNNQFLNSLIYCAYLLILKKGSRLNILK